MGVLKILAVYSRTDFNPNINIDKMELPKEKLLAFVIVFVVVNIDCNFASSNRGELK